MEGSSIVLLKVFIWADIIGNDSAWLLNFALVDITDEEFIIFVPFMMIKFADDFFLFGLLYF